MRQELVRIGDRHTTVAPSSPLPARRVPSSALREGMTVNPYYPLVIAIYLLAALWQGNLGTIF